MWWILLRLRLKAFLQSLFQKNSRGKPRSRAFMLLMGILFLYVLACFFAFFGMLFDSLLPLCRAGYGWLYFGFAGILSLVLGVFLNMFAASDILFAARDNELLLSMPIRPRAILLSRMALLYVLALFYGCLVSFPAIFIYVRAFGAGLGQLACMLLCILLLPLLTNAIGSVIGYVLSYITARFRKGNLVTALASLAFLVLYFYGYSRIQSYITYLLSNAERIAASLEAGAFPVYHFGMAMAEGSPVSLLLFGLMAAAPFGLVYLLLARSFISIATNPGRARRLVYRQRRLKSRSPGSALVRREIRRLSSNSMVLLNAALGLPLMVAAAVFFLIKRDTLLGLLPFLNGAGEMPAALAALCLCACSATTFLSAISVSLEGRHFWIIRSLPVRAGDVLRAKAAAQICMAAPFLLISQLLCVIGLWGQEPLAVAAFLALPWAFTAFTAYLGVTVNLHFPKLDWMNEVLVAKQGLSTMVCMFANFALVAAPALLYGFILAERISLAAYMLLSSLLLFGGSLALRGYLGGRGAARFEAL